MKYRETDQEVRLARNLAAGFTAMHENIGLDYARKKYAHEPLPDYWVALAEKIIEDLILRPGRYPRTPAAI